MAGAASLLALLTGLGILTGSAAAGGAGGAGGNGDSRSPAISASGRHVAYTTRADNLGGPAEDVRNIYSYDFERKRTRLISRRSG